MRNFFTIVVFVFLTSCTVAPVAVVNSRPASPSAVHFAAQRVSAIIVARSNDISPWLYRQFDKSLAPRDAELGTATPITPDGYFLTADHVIKNSDGKTIHLIYGRGSNAQLSKARIVWRDSAHDLAVVHAPLVTKLFYQFTPTNITLPVGTSLFHGGLTTGIKSGGGKLSDPIFAERGFSASQKFRLDIPLQPGDSGGPVLDANARLVGINSAVEYLIPLETPIFTESHGCRPNVKKLFSKIDEDRAARR